MWCRPRLHSNRIPVLALVAAVVVALTLTGPFVAHGEGTFSGVMFADYFYNAQGSGVVADSSGFQFRRVYFTYDTEFDSKFATRFQLEADEKELTSKGKIGVFVKQAFLRWKEFLPNGALVAGISPTPLWGTAEGVWGYRSIEKTTLDLRGFGSATDMGVALQGKLGSSGRVGYHVMFGNGVGQKPESDRSRKAYLAVPLRWGAFVVEPVADYEGGPGDLDRYTMKLLAGWQKDPSAVGMDGFRRVNLNAGTGGADVVPMGFSVFARGKVATRWSALARYDYFDPDTEEDAGGYRQHLAIAGLDYSVSSNAHLIPNLIVVTYAAKGSGTPERDTDVVLRLTLVANYK